MEVEHHPDWDILYVRLTDTRRTRTEPFGERRIIDYDDAIVGVEFLDASEGVDLGGLPGQKAILRALEESEVGAPFLRGARRLSEKQRNPSPAVEPAKSGG